MTSEHTNPKIDKSYVAVFIMAVFLSWTLHELAHWAVGEYLGYKMVMTLNRCYPINGQFSKDLHYQIISAAGPIFTLSEAFLVFILIIRRKRILFYPFIFICFICDFLRQ